MTAHLFAWDPRTAAIPARPRPGDGRIGFGARACVACLMLEDFALTFDTLEDGTPGPCPGPPLAGVGELPGTPACDADGNLSSVPAWPAIGHDPDGHGG